VALADQKQAQSVPSANVLAGGVTKSVKFSIRKTVTITYSHWLICLGFCLACTVLPGGGGDALGVSREDTRAEGSSPVSLSLSLSVPGLLRGVNHVVVVFVLVFVMRVVRLGLAVVRACALRGTHGGLRWVRVLHKECRR
jgi:hypothetical protein